MLKILAVIPSGFCFGLQNVTLSFFSARRKELNPFFLLTKWTDGELAKRLDKLNIPYDYSWLGMFSRKLDWPNLRMTLHCGSRLVFLYRDYLRVVRTFKPNLIYAANHHELLLLWPVLKLMNIPVVCHVHDPPPPARFYHSIYRVIDTFTDSFIAISTSVSERIQALGIEQKKIRLVHNGIDLSGFPLVSLRSGIFQNEYGWPQDSLIIGITGQVLEEKGHGDLVDAMLLVRQTNDRIRLVIGGRQKGQYFQKLKKQVSDLGLNDIVRFSGWQDSVADFFAGLDIFVLASRQEEGFGLVVAEAMATGLPVIATPSGGAKEVVVDGVSGIIVGKQNPKELASAILALADSEEYRHQMGCNGRARVEQNFNLSTQSKRLADVLREVAKQDGN
jgi:glycosyltransferase involved in cell wall biosynthesis